MDYEEFEKCLEHLGFTKVKTIHEKLKLIQLASKCWKMLKGQGSKDISKQGF